VLMLHGCVGVDRLRKFYYKIVCCWVWADLKNSYQLEELAMKVQEHPFFCGDICFTDLG
jgi:hypothetical protein